MALIRINPTKVLVGGDQDKAKAFIGPAKSQLEILKQGMSFQNLTQGIRRIWLNDDVFVECRKIFNYQECRIWVRPVAAEQLEDVGIYFYIHIVKPNTGSNRGEDIDRLILWRLREEEKTAPGVDLSQPTTEYDSYGEYENPDGTAATLRKWGITNPGAVILDVDLATNTVYSESGTDEDENPILVDNELTEEAQIAMAQQYIDAIYPTNAFNDNVIPAYAETGDIYSPFASARSCYSPAIYDYVDATPEVLFNETLDIDLGGGATDGFYHVRTEVTGVDPIPWCADPEDEYESIDWIKLDENADKYLPSTQTSGDAGYYECGVYCYQSIVNSPNPTYAFYSWARYPCHTDVSSEKGDHIEGRYFIDQQHASFFVTLIGNSTTHTQQRKALPDGLGYSPADLWEDSMWPDPITSDGHGYSYGSATLGTGSSSISTPLEQAIPFKTILWVPEDLPSVQQDFYKWAGSRKTATISFQESFYYILDEETAEIEQLNLHHPGDWWAGYPDVSTLAPTGEYSNVKPYMANMSFSEIDSDFYSAINIFNGPDNYHVPLVIYYEANHQGKIGHAFGAGTIKSTIGWFYDAWPTEAETITDVTTHPNYLGSSSSSLPLVDIFKVAIVFNLMQISTLTETDDEGNTIYWDIHTERESSQDIDNHNREKILGAYVSAALKDIKQLPDMQEVDGTYKLLSDCELTILTGYVYQ